MERSQKDVPAYEEVDHHLWNYQTNPTQIGSKQQQDGHRTSQILMPDPRLIPESMSRSNYLNSDVFHPEMVYGSSANSYIVNRSNVQPVVNHNISMLPSYTNCPSDNGNSKVMRVFYDENNQPQLIVPVNYEPYELFSNGPHQIPQFSNGGYTSNNIHGEQYLRNSLSPQSERKNSIASQPQVPNQTLIPPRPTNLIDQLLGNCGYWAPFGQNYEMDSQNSMILGGEGPKQQMHTQNIDSGIVNSLLNNKPVESLKKNSDFGIHAETGSKPRAVAEVKPMRPSYSDVLVKNSTKEKVVHKTENLKKPKHGAFEAKHSITTSKMTSSKPDKGRNQSRPLAEKLNDEKLKSDFSRRNYISQVSSGSDSGDNNANIEPSDSFRKSTKTSKSKSSNHRRKWSSLDNLGENDKNHSDSVPYNSDFVFIAAEEVNVKKNVSRKNHNEKAKILEKRDSYSFIDNFDESDGNGNKLYSEYQQEPSYDTDKIKNRKPKDGRTPNGTSKSSNRPGSDKKKLTQNKNRKFKQHRYVGIVHVFLNNWIAYIMKFLLWIWNLISDIMSMSAHLSFDLLSVTCTQGYDYSQAVWKSMKLYISKATTGKVFTYIDKKFGHTKFGYWRKFKWFKKHFGTEKNEEEEEPVKNNRNIPLPATGDEAMKRLLACKGKDPYSILGVGVKCSDEEIKRYYRKQAFLVHPDKNQIPGAEEAFKILQHAFDLIGEPERRSAYDRRVLESHHVEAAWSELNDLLAQLHEKMEFAANTIRCTNCGRRHKRVLTDRPCYAARSCSQCKIRHSAKEGDIWAETSFWGLVLVFYACMDGAVYQITQWASCQKKNLKHLRPDCHVVQYRIVLGNKAGAGVGSGNNTSATSPGNTSIPGSSGTASANPNASASTKQQSNSHDVNLEEFLNNLYSKSGQSPTGSTTKTSTCSPDQHESSKFKRRNRKGKI